MMSDTEETRKHDLSPDDNSDGDYKRPKVEPDSSSDFSLDESDDFSFAEDSDPGQNPNDDSDFMTAIKESEGKGEAATEIPETDPYDKE